MGCTQSKIENEEAVSRCKERKQFMKDAVAARNALAAAHCAYAMSLKNTGAALSDYAQGEVQNPHSIAPSSSAAAAAAALPAQAPFETLPPPPPPIPADIASPPLQRASSMPEFVVSKPSIHPSEPIIEEEDEDEIENEGGGLRRRSNSRSSRGGGGDGGGGSVGGGRRVRLDEDGPPPPPSPPPETPPPIKRAPPPPPDASNSTWDFFFNVDDMPGGSLGDVEDMRREREEMERKVLEEERAKRSREMVNGGSDAGGVAGGGGTSRNRKVENVEAVETGKMVEKPPLPPQQVAGPGKIVKRSKQVVGVGTGGEGKKVGKYVNLLQVFNDLDDCFLKASERAHEVSKMLEAARLHYHSNFADNRGHIDHSARVLRVITWNRSFRGLPNADEGKDDFDSEENETHATVLDKLLAWEKKLYDEVKAGELMKFEYNRKVTLLSKQKKRGTNPEALEKTKAAVSHLHTRYIVDMQSLDSTVSEINRLRDDQLYPKLVALVDAMAAMWEAMDLQHSDQLKIAVQMKGIDISQSTKETSEHHRQRTFQLWLVVQEWHTQLEKMVSHQKEYIRALNSWLKLNLIPIESSLKEKVSSPPRVQRPPIQALLVTWHTLLEKLPAEHAKSAIYSFEAILHTLVQQQEDELKLKARCEESRKDLLRKKCQYDDWYRKYKRRRTTPGEMDPDRPEDMADGDIVAKHFVVETAEKKLEEDEEAYSKQCVHVREKSLVSLKTRMPELFHAMAEFAQECSRMYRDLSATSKAQKRTEISS